MGRPPYCDKVGIKKGPWTPEEDIILVSYIQEHGPGNWRSVPTNTGLLRCSKSCRLRWTNYLRPGIKRGNFTPHEEGMIIHLQALLGNKWAAIASYLPQRTDNDIKNYWNTHLKKKLKKFQSAAALEPHHGHVAQDLITSHFSPKYKSFSNERRGLDFTNQAAAGSNSNHLISGLNNNIYGSSYASSTENISRLLEGWMRSSPTTNNNKIISNNNNSNSDLHKGDEEEEKSSSGHNIIITNNINNDRYVENAVAAATATTTSHIHCYRPKEEQEDGGRGGDLISNEEFISILSFENLNNVAAWDKSTSDVSTTKGSSQNPASITNGEDKVNNNITAAMGNDQTKQRSENTNPPLSFLEKWLLDESSGQVDEINHIIELSDEMF